VDRKIPVGDVLIGLDITAAVIHVQLEGDVAIVLQREEMMVGLENRESGRSGDVAGLDRCRSGLGDADDGCLRRIVETQDERLEVRDDLMDVFHDTRNGLVLVYDTVDAESPNGGAAQR